jgi:hypothetical protein
MGGAPESDPPAGYSQWTDPSPMMQRPFGAYMRFPPLRGGYDSPINFAAKGIGLHYKRGGHVPLDEPIIQLDRGERTAGQVWALLQKIERDNPHVTGNQQFSYLCQRCPEVRKLFAKLLSRGWSRDGAIAQIVGDLRRETGNMEE